MKFPPSRFLARSMAHHPHGMVTARILAAAISAVDPEHLIRRAVSLEGDTLHLQQQVIDLTKYPRIHLLGIGKAAHPMTLSCAALLGERLTSGLILSKIAGPIPEALADRVKLFTGGHPLPTQAGMEAAQEILKGLSGLEKADLVLVLISGGSSALFSLPASGLTLQDLITTNRLLLGSGADINQINIVRKHLSRVKGGRLAQELYPATVASLILSDVPGNQLDRVGSGPTLPDPSTFQDALAVLKRSQLFQHVPKSVLEVLEAGSQGKVPETPKPGDSIFKSTSGLLIGSNRDALDAAIRQAREEGFHAQEAPLTLQGEAQAAGKELADLLKGLARAGQPLGRPACLIAGGETTVTLPEDKQAGKGGRNLELALSAAAALDGLEDCALISLASDGEDGITDAAGAVVTGSSLSRARQAGLDPQDFLERHDSYPFFDRLGDLLQPGSTATNVNDLCFLFTYR